MTSKKQFEDCQASSRSALGGVRFDAPMTDSQLSLFTDAMRKRYDVSMSSPSAPDPEDPKFGLSYPAMVAATEVLCRWPLPEELGRWAEREGVRVSPDAIQGVVVAAQARALGNVLAGEKAAAARPIAAAAGRLPGPVAPAAKPDALGGGKPHSNMAMLNLLTRAGWRSATTAHGFRSVLNTWATETTDHAQIVIDMALSHEIGSKVEKAYRRGDLADRRLALLKDWEAYLGSYKPPQSPTP